MKYRFDPRALAEFEEAVDYYLRQSPDAASWFVDEFEAAVSFVLENPRTPLRVEGRVDGEIRRWNLRRFPYAMFYRPNADGITIISMMHARRDPDFWKTRG